jgi:uncharacterized glyoxalase superfamily protein PhnB
MKIQSYLMFNGRTEEALKFYEKALGAKIEMMMRRTPEGTIWRTAEEAR